jgi:hypothetical protein
MEAKELVTLLHDVERWALDERERLIYAGTRPVSNCPTVEAAGCEAAIASGNTMAHRAEITEIEAVSAHAGQCLGALQALLALRRP